MRSIFLLLIFTLFLASDSLDSLINYAIKHSPIIKSTIADIKIASLKRERAKRAQFGNIDLVASYTHYNIERTLAPLPPSAMKSKEPITVTKDIYSWGVNYSVALFVGFAQVESIKISELAKRLASKKLHLTKEELVFNIKNLYLSILAQKELLAANISYLNALRRVLKVVSYQVELGKKAQIDKIKTSAEISQLKAQIESIKGNIQITKETLGALVGRKVGKINRIKIKIKRFSNRNLKRALKKVPYLDKIKIEDISIKKAQRMIRKSRSKRYPQVFLNAYYGKNYGEDIYLDKWDNKEVWQAGINIKYNLIDFGQNSLEIEEAKVEKLKAQLKKVQKLLDLKRDITKVFEKIKINYSLYLANRENYKLAQKAYEIELTRYKNALSTVNDLLIAKAKAQLALAKIIESKYEYQKSIYLLDYILERGVK